MEINLENWYVDIGAKTKSYKDTLESFILLVSTRKVIFIEGGKVLSRSAQNDKTSSIWKICFRYYNIMLKPVVQ